MTMLASESRRYEFTNLHSTNFNKNYIKMLISKAKKIHKIIFLINKTFIKIIFNNIKISVALKS